MLTRRHIEKLNAQQKARNPVPLLAAGTALATLLLFLVGFLLLDSLLVGAGLVAVALMAGGALTFTRHRQYVRAQSVEIQYGMMDAATAARFSRVQRAFEVLVASERIWRADQPVGKPGEARPIEIRMIDPPHLSTDVDVWNIDTGRSSAFFLPEAILVYHEGKYRAISYQALRVEMSSERTVEEGEVPSDAEVVGKTWRYLARDGTSPDLTRPFNPQLPQVVYGVLRLRADNWEGADLRVSSESAAAQFVLAFLDIGPNPERVERWFSVRPYEEWAKGDPAYAVLGLEDGASKNEVTTAYRRIARAYHPDRTANFVPEFRALADKRMKEINAAYSRLRRAAT